MVEHLCKNCRSWNKYDNSCYKAEWDGLIDNNQLSYYAEAHDDSGLYAGIKTGPNFGCVLFEERKNVST